MAKKKSQKKSWKNLAKGIEQGLPEYHAARALRELPDSAIFEIDDKPAGEPLTHRQKRLAAHRARLAQLAEDAKADVKDIKPVLKTIAKEKRVVLAGKSVRNKVERKELAPLKGKAVVGSDPWGEDDTIDNSYLAPVVSHDLKTRRKTPAKIPRGTKNYVASVAPKVKLPDAGASFNPRVVDYFTYVNKIADEEVAREEKIAKVHKSMKLKDGQSYITEDEKQTENEQGFFESESSDDSEDDESTEPAPAKRPQPKPKTDKQRKRQLRHKIMEMTRKAQKELTKKERIEFANLKKTYKEITQKLAESKAKAESRRLQKVYDSLTSRKKLGRGEFKQYEEPVLLPDELTGSMRLTKTEGNIISERFKSMQERNIIPVSGDKDSKKLPKRLKRKWVERRDTKDVAATS